jgi:chromosome transmission fidelity protein 1
LDLAHEQLETYLEKYRKRLKGKNIFYIQQLLYLIDHFNSLLKKESREGEEKETEVYNLVEFTFKIQADNINIFKILKYMKNSQICRKVKKKYLTEADDEIPF